MRSHPRRTRAPGCCPQPAEQWGELQASQGPLAPEPPGWGSRRLRSVGWVGEGSTVGPPGLLRLGLSPGPQQWPADPGGRWGAGTAGASEPADGGRGRLRGHGWGDRPLSPQVGVHPSGPESQGGLRRMPTAADQKRGSWLSRGGRGQPGPEGSAVPARVGGKGGIGLGGHMFTGLGRRDCGQGRWPDKGPGGGLGVGWVPRCLGRAGCVPKPVCQGGPASSRLCSRQRWHLWGLLVREAREQDPMPKAT